MNTERTKWRATALAAASVMALGLTPGLALAQESDGSSQQGGLEEIVVTARKRAETVQDVPAVVTAISTAQINRYDLTSLERVAAQTPSFVIGRAPAGSGATLVLRGIGANTTSIGLEQSVAVIVDGTYYGQGRTINEGFFDLGRLEILKGPQTLFFGKNATAGVVSITTADPGDRLEVIARAGYEFKANQVVGEAILSTPINDQLGIRLAVRASSMGAGYYDQIGATQTYPTLDRTSTAQTVTPTVHSSQAVGDGRVKEFYIRGTIKWRPTSDFTATIKANYGSNKSDNPGSNGVLFYCPSGVSALNPAISCKSRFRSSANYIPSDIAATMPYANPDGALGNDYRSWAINSNLVYSTDNFNITSVTNYNANRNIFQLDGDIVSAPGAPSAWVTERSGFHAFSSELRLLTTFKGPLNAMLGGYYQKTKREYLSWTASGGLENSAAAPAYNRYIANSKDSQTNGQTLAAFGQVVYKPVEQIEIAGGVRYTHETKDSYFVQPYSHPIREAQGIFLAGQTINSNLAFDNWSPEATISFKPDRNVNIYVAYKTAFKSGGFSNGGILSPSAGLPDFEFTPEKARGFEAGIKTTLFDRQLRFNIAAYAYKFTDLQLDFFRSDIFALTTINAGSATTKGVELEFEFAPRAVPGFDLHGSLNYNRARYGDAPGAPCWAGQTRAQGCDLVYVNDGTPNGSSRPFDAATDAAANRQNLKGSPTANAPDWTASLGASYETPITAGLVLGLSADARYSSSYLVSAFANPFSRQNAYVNLDAAIRLRSEDSRWELALIGKNLTNRWYATASQDAPNTGSGTGTTVGVVADQVGYGNLPRTVQIQATFHY